MKILRGLETSDPAMRGASAAIGNFDGVHRGHQKVIAVAREAGERIGAPPGVVTFEPHPRQVFAPDAPPFRLMNAEARANRLARVGVERLYELPFGRALAALSPEAFAETVLARGLGLAHVVVGADFCFGKARAGTAADLVQMGEAFGFGTTIVPLLGRGGDGTPADAVSSTAIRQALSDGRCEDAARMLGHWHRIEGEVIHGEKRGRTLGFPTANMSLDGLHQPRHGVYAVLADILTGPDAGRHHAVASIGVRPMFGENRPNLETHLFGFTGDLYGQHLSIALVEWLRPERRFDGVEALVAQMRSDSRAAQERLAKL